MGAQISLGQLCPNDYQNYRFGTWDDFITFYNNIFSIFASCLQLIRQVFVGLHAVSWSSLARYKLSGSSCLVYSLSTSSQLLPTSLPKIFDFRSRQFNLTMTGFKASLHSLHRLFYKHKHIKTCRDFIASFVMQSNYYAIFPKLNFISLNFSPVPRIRRPWLSWTCGSVRAWRRSSYRACLSSTSRLFFLLPLSPLLLTDKRVRGNYHYHW